MKDKKELEKPEKGLKRPLTPETSESDTETEIPRKASSAKKPKLSCKNCDFVAFEQFYMDIHKEVCKGKEATEAKTAEASEDEGGAADFEKQDDFDDDNGPATPKVEVKISSISLILPIL